MIATLDALTLQRSSHSVHYETQLPRTMNVQVNWQAKSEWI